MVHLIRLNKNFKKLRLLNRKISQEADLMFKAMRSPEASHHKTNDFENKPVQHIEKAKKELEWGHEP